MDRLRKYIINNLYMIFLSMFMPLFAIASVIFMIKLATYTAIIQLSIWDMTKLYLFVLPEILFYTLPITFFIAATLSLFKLSTDNEMVVLFALGIHPKFIIKTLFKPSLLLSILLSFNFLVLFPHSTTLSSNFVSYKKSEAKFNLSASEFGHSFGDWLLYIGEDNKDETYSDVILFNKKKKEEILISAKKAEIINDAGILRLKLIDGEGYSYSKEEFSQIDFDTMYINNTMTTDLSTYKTPLEYWQSDERKESKTQMMITDTLLSLFPLISLFLVVSIGVVHVRHQKGRIYLYLFFGVLIFYGMTLG
ncbi:LptF/LptG family permease, partial [Sulfurimonas sp.]|uniref:LptF/LptG family permease n=1 Tax=Sulfurimonas sp. TaxID=2022749 RepID=UPI0025FC1677